jgi:hypothetical protein
MKFVIKYGQKPINRMLTYIEKECSFDMTPFIPIYNFEIILNKLGLSIVDKKIIQFCGFCGLSESKATDFNVPIYKNGELIILNDFEFGFAYSINNYEWPIYINYKSEWICIGNPQHEGEAVEFINNCIAVVGAEGDFKSLWLKPNPFPTINKDVGFRL